MQSQHPFCVGDSLQCIVLLRRRVQGGMVSMMKNDEEGFEQEIFRLPAFLDPSSHLQPKEGALSTLQEKIQPQNLAERGILNRK